MSEPTRSQVQELAARMEREHAQFEAVLQAVPDGIVVFDADGTALLVNEAEARINGFSSPAEMLQKLAFFAENYELVEPGGRVLPVAEWPVSRILRGETVPDTEVRGRRKDIGREWIFTIGGSPVLDERGRTVLAVTITRDITERRRAEQRLAARTGATLILAESASLEEAAPPLLEHVAATLGWLLAELWLVHPASGRLRRQCAWQAPQAGLEEMVAAGESLTFSPGEGLPGQVWAAGRSFWVPDLAALPNVPRAALAGRLGLKGLLGFPIRAGDEVLGIALFAAAETRSPEPELLEALDVIGSQIGQFIQRRRAEEALQETRTRNEFLADLVRSASQAVGVGYPDGSLGLVNRAFEELTGYTSEELRAIDWATALTPPEWRELERDKLAELARTGQPVRYEKEYVRKDGRRVPIELLVHVQKDPEGRPKYYFSFLTDITERRRARQALRESEARFRLALRNAPVSVAAQDRDLRYVWAYNQRTARPEEILGHLDEELFTAAEAARLGVIKRRVLQEGVEVREQMWFERPGSRMFLDVYFEPIRNESGEVTGVATMTLDLTPTKLAEEALRESEERLRFALETGRTGAWDLDLVDHTAFRSLGHDRIFGYPELLPEWTYEMFLEHVVPEDRPAVDEKFRRATENRDDWSFECRIRRADGALRWIWAAGRHVADASGTPRRMAGIVQDITDRRHAEDALRESEARYRTLVELSPEAVFVNQDGRFAYANSVAIRMLGARDLDDLVGREVLDLVHPEDREMVAGRVRGASAGDRVPLRPMRMMRLDGQVLQIESTAAPIEFQGRPAVQAVFRDVSERRRLEERLAQSQKMEAIGLLAGGVAHDFNNLLVGVIGNASLLQDLLPPDSPAQAPLDRIVRAGEQAANLTRQLLAYAGKGRVAFEPFDLSDLVRGGADLLRSNIPGKVVLHLDLPAVLPPVLADRSQIQQVLMNLVINAAEAIGSGAGEITIRTALRELGDGELGAEPGGELQPGAYVCLEVADTGGGMSEETRERIFDPFFTTKFLGRGLGLAAVGGILRSHGGAIRVVSEPGRGSLFTVLLPASGLAVPAAPDATPPRESRNSGTVLIVDDEALVLETAQAALERRGYEVLAVSSGAEAVAVFRREAPRIRLVILDLSMPGMGGEEVLPLLREVRRGVPVVISSGYSQDDAEKRFPRLAAMGFIQKPYTAARLAEEVARVLAGSDRGRS